MRKPQHGAPWPWAIAGSAAPSRTTSIQALVPSPTLYRPGFATSTATVPPRLAGSGARSGGRAKRSAAPGARPTRAGWLTAMAGAASAVCPATTVTGARQPRGGGTDEGVPGGHSGVAAINGKAARINRRVRDSGWREQCFVIKLIQPLQAVRPKPLDHREARGMAAR